MSLFHRNRTLTEQFIPRNGGIFMPEESPGQQPCASHACMDEYTDIGWARRLS